MPSSDTPQNLKPTHGAPHDTESLDGCEGIGWDLSWGFRLNIGHDTAEDPTSPLVIGAGFSDVDEAAGIVVREATPEQLEEFARLLLNLAAKHRRRMASRSNPVTGQCPTCEGTERADTGVIRDELGNLAYCDDDWHMEEGEPATAPNVSGGAAG